jgi:peroxiredoxin family protein
MNATPLNATRPITHTWVAFFEPFFELTIHNNINHKTTKMIITKDFPMSLNYISELCNSKTKKISNCLTNIEFIGLAYQGKDIVYKFIIEYSSLRDFGPCKLVNNNRSIFI